MLANKLFLRLMGYEEHELLDQAHAVLCAPDYVASAEYLAFWAALRAGQGQSGEFRRLDKSGRTVWLQATYTPVLGAHGEVERIIKFAVDVTQSKTRALEDQGKIDAISRSQGVVEFDMGGKVLGANENFLRLMDYTLDEIRDQHHRMFVDKNEVQTAAYRSFWQRLGRGMYDSGEYLRFGKNGKRVWLQATYNPIFDLDGQPVKRW